MRDCCGCCQRVKPRYKRNVDAVYPAYPELGIGKSSLDKLMHYAIQHPEKLDRIGEYIALRVQRDLSRQRHEQLIVALEILNALLDACNSQCVNMFVSSLLRILEDLLQCPNEEVMLRATDLFIAFSRKEEEAPCYDRNYRFFVEKFSQMCHSNNNDQDKRNLIRVSGIRGLQGVVRKTVSDNLQMNIWDKEYMDKIIPSLLFNMQDEEPSEDGQEAGNACIVAADVLRELVGHTEMETWTRAFVRPTLMHIEKHKLWKDFGITWFRIIMFSVQNQFSYIVVEELVGYLTSDNVKNSDIQLRSYVVDVLTETATIVAKNASPHINTITKKIVNCLKEFMFMPVKHDVDEKRFHESIVKMIGEFASCAPDYQKSDILNIIMEHVCSAGRVERTEIEKTKIVQFQSMLLKSILRMTSNTSKTTHIETTFTKTFCSFAVKLSKSGDADIRQTIQEIFQCLLDRHKNLKKIKQIKIALDVSSLDLVTPHHIMKEDTYFMKRADGGQMLLQIIKDGSLPANNTVDNFVAIYRTLVLICLEVPVADVFIDVFKVGLEMQDVALSTPSATMFMTHKCAIHALIAALFNILAQIADIEELVQYVHGVIKERENSLIGQCYLPDFAFNRLNKAKDYPTSDTFNEEWKFNKGRISEILKDCDQYDESLLFKPIEVPDSVTMNDSIDMCRSLSDIRSLSTLSIASTPFGSRAPSLDSITVDQLKKVLVTTDKEREIKEKEQRKIFESFKNDDFESIMMRSKNVETDDAHKKLLDILEIIDNAPNGSACRKMEVDRTRVNEIEYPELFLY
ncbi:DgyrCDS2657 [Dimorphilus gyrociliatus]|uniref:DgyrCDS2657 n=1 Tax=Dimorphilus gyrociliatus TaxID=2664684 RepID=A0A7I8VAY2_9ANNE|nr:DgyrCDS2657 [Dimorphilus gyrociliatus]